MIGGKQLRCVVNAKSRAEAARLTGLSAGYIKEYWSVTGNLAELAYAEASPGIPLVFRERWNDSIPVPLSTLSA